MNFLTPKNVVAPSESAHVTDFVIVMPVTIILEEKMTHASRGKLKFEQRWIKNVEGFWNVIKDDIEWDDRNGITPKDPEVAMPPETTYHMQGTN